MILKQLRLSRHLSQEQLANMSGLNVRTIQRIESGHKASVESLKCLASVLEVDVSTLTQERFKMDKHSENWQALPLLIKTWFILNFLNMRPNRKTSKRIEHVCHAFGFLFCAIGLVNRAALEGGLILLTNAYIFQLLSWQGDHYGIWYDPSETKSN